MLFKSRCLTRTSWLNNPYSISRSLSRFLLRRNHLHAGQFHTRVLLNHRTTYLGAYCYKGRTGEGNCTHVFGGRTSQTTPSYTYFTVEQCRQPLPLLMTIPCLLVGDSFSGARALAATEDTLVSGSTGCAVRENCTHNPRHLTRTSSLKDTDEHSRF